MGSLWVSRMQSSATSLSVSRTPFFVAAGLFAAAAVFVARVSSTKLDALELVCFGACLVAAGACAAIPFAFFYARRHKLPATAPASGGSSDPAALAAHIGNAVDARLAAALPAFTAQLAEALAALEDKRRAEVLLAVAETPAPRPFDSDTIPVSTGKPRLGRGLEGLIRGNAPSASPAPVLASGSDPSAA